MKSSSARLPSMLRASRLFVVLALALLMGSLSPRGLMPRFCMARSSATSPTRPARRFPARPSPSRTATPVRRASR